MYVAIDKIGNRIYADDEQRYMECFCPACGELLTHRKGSKKRAHFAHKQNTNCFMGLNKDYMSEWHIRMQSYFSKESREYRFQDMETGEIHIADVFDSETNTVIEFQHSPIHEDEYLSRTYFHLNNGRRIVWIFDESRENTKDGYKGRLKHDDLCVPCWNYGEISLGWLYKEQSFKWMYTPRKFLSLGPKLTDYSDRYSVFVYTGEENVVYRIISEEYNFEYITLSVCETIMIENMSTDLFFVSERELLLQTPWKEMIADKIKECEESRARIQEGETYMRNARRASERKAKGLNEDLSICPLCGGILKLRIAKKGRCPGHKFYGCGNYPKCNFTEDF